MTDTDRPAIVAFGPLYPYLDAELERRFTVHAVPADADLAALSPAIRAARALVSFGSVGAPAAIMDALKRISPNASTARDLARHLSLDAERTDRALNLLSAITAVDTMPKGDDRIARLHARLRARLSDVAVVAL